MRLTSIKLAGFKSFVEPTILKFHSNLTAIVGPNGCGKSNIVDAIRWVIGESAAKQLRGESLSDVIFNGTNTRKPLGQAAIELHFDNEDGTLGGAFANYPEIAIRREIDREAQSKFYLNSTRCRRRDIMDIFLGTGLGPRSYAIIEQGMISRLVEAKPEDMRVHLEEAAGITKYKERRKETENRIRYTRENLTRLSDVREALGTQLERLKKQAKAAERYKTLRQEEHLLKAQLQALNWQKFNSKASKLAQSIKQTSLDLEAKKTSHGQIDTSLVQLRDQHEIITSELNGVQSKYYAIGAEIAALEQTIKHLETKAHQTQQDLSKTESDSQALEVKITTEKEATHLLQEEMETFVPQLESAKNAVVQHEKILSETENAMYAAQQAWEEFSNEANERLRKAEVAEAQVRHLDEQRSQLIRQIAQAEDRRQHIKVAELDATISKLEESCWELREKLDARQEEVDCQVKELTNFRRQRTELQQIINQQTKELRTLLGQKTTLTALQEVALGKSHKELNQWLQSNSLSEQARLAETLRVTAGWERAVEVVLGSYLEAVCVEDIMQFASGLSDFQGGNLTLLAQSSRASSFPQGTLADYVQTKGIMLNQLRHVFVAESLPQALTILSTLSCEQSVVTREGIWIGKDWLRVNKAEDNKEGVIARENELKKLTVQITQLQTSQQKNERILEDGQEKIMVLEQAVNTNQMQARALHTEYSQTHGQLEAAKARREQVMKESARLLQDIQQAQQQKMKLETELTQAKEAWSSALAQKTSDVQRLDSLTEQRNHLRESYKEAREKVKVSKQEEENLRSILNEKKQSHQYKIQNIDQLQQQRQQLTERKKQLQAFIEFNKPQLEEAQTELQKQLAQRLEVEKTLSEIQTNVDERHQAIREQERNRQLLNGEIDKLRDALTQLQMDHKVLQVKADTISEEIETAQFHVSALLKAMPEDAACDSWKEKLEQVRLKVQRLGAINLAAIEEYQQTDERKTYLDTQHEDLTSALGTLENAIARIDRETRLRLRETFEQVNEHFRRLFPTLFGGGKAELQLTENEVLTSGVMVLAQPPGKRNTTIHLLSGGEKALTAVALVFAFFQLNPAPFCLLDEVDAPLDDVNVGRFCQLLKNMAEKVQFIFITHNKIAMELAEQLAGVTMQEPGVSRLVSVDVAAALKMTEN